MNSGTIKEYLLRAYWVLNAQFGIDIRKTVLSLKGLPRYVRDYSRFRAGYGGKLLLRPCLHDWYAEGGTTKSEYFWQDLLVARMVHACNPRRHIDVGSRVDGFVAHVATFRDIEVFDVRPVSTQVPGVTFKQADIMNPVGEMEACCDSLSCLHALEHFGLGRYGDPIDPDGFRSGIRSMARFLEDGGRFYLSVPIGEARVEFNAHRIFDPAVIVDVAKENALALTGLLIINKRGGYSELDPANADLSALAEMKYALGVFTFTRNAG